MSKTKIYEKVAPFIFFSLLWSCKKEIKSSAPLAEKKNVSKETTAFKINTINNSVDSIAKSIEVESKEFFLTKIPKPYNGDIDATETIFLKNKRGEVIAEHTVEVEAYEDAKVFEITNHNLKNVKKILNFTIEECYCGCSITNVYIIQTLDNQYIELPIISFSSVEASDPYYEYLFGKLNTFYSIEKLYDISKNNLNPIEINRLEKLTWNGSKIINKTELNATKYIVTALNGLTIRDKPSLKGKKIGRLPFMAKTTIQEITKYPLEIKDNGKLIKGNWVKIENDLSNNWSVGYVFNGFLQKESNFIKTNTAILVPSCYSDSYEKPLIDKLNTNWVQLYKENGNYYLNTPQFNKKRGYNECTGDSLTCLSSKKETLLFINKFSLRNSFSEIIFTETPSDVIWSGNEFKFELNTKNYTLKASGNFTNIEVTGDKTYTLSIQSEGKSQIIFQQTQFDDTVPKILFIGDINNDGNPDFIIDSPIHYEQERKILFLSPSDNKGNLIEKFAEISLDFSC